MPPYAFFRKQFMPLAEAKVGVLTHALHYGSACFEGIRGNWNSDQEQLYLFRMKEHYRRLHQGCRILKIKMPYSVDELCDLTLELVIKSGYREDVYIRPLAYKSEEKIGVRLHDIKDDFLIVVTTLAAYLEADNGVRCCTSSWRRVDDTMIPARGKITGIYVNSALAKSEAIERGFDEAIMLTADGHVSEGSGENIFVLIRNKLLTPPSSIDRSELYTADEAFFTGTAAHVTPIIEVDERPVGDGKPGKISQQLQKLYFDTIQGKNPKLLHWCTPVYAKEKTKVR
jgi:branched-chain amino acid aminotransferase